MRILSLAGVLLISMNTTALSQDVTDGPFGLVWGSSLADNPYEVIREEDPASASGEAGSCKLVALKQTYDVGNYKMSYEVGNNNNLALSLLMNNAKRDTTIGGRVKAVIISGKVLEVVLPICLVYFDDKLSTVFLAFTSLTAVDLESKFTEIFLSKYGSTSIGSPSNMSWIREYEKTVITWAPGDYWAYFYAPVKSEQVKAWQEFYTKAAETGDL